MSVFFVIVDQKFANEPLHGFKVFNSCFVFSPSFSNDNIFVVLMLNGCAYLKSNSIYVPIINFYILNVTFDRTFATPTTATKINEREKKESDFERTKKRIKL